MRSTHHALYAALGTALASALVTLNFAWPAERLGVPSLLATPPTEADTMPLFGPVEMLLAQQPKEQPKAPTPAVPVEQTPSAPPVTPAAPPSVARELATDLLGGRGGGAGAGGAVHPGSTSGGALSASQQAAPTTSANVVGGGEAVSRASSDVGDLLGKSLNSLGVWVHKRSPIITDPIVRGYHLGQYVTQADGGYWFPARIDLDTVVSKIDSSQIENVVIIRGPYSVRYGPGFAFFDVETLSTPRYECGCENHGMSGLTYQSNGQQWLGIQSLWGGSENFGYRANYIIGTGTDYWDGNGVRQPSGYNTQTFNLDFGFTLGRYSRLEMKAMHVEQHAVKIPGYFFDIGFLSSDAYTVRYHFNDPDRARIGVDTWFNYTDLDGNNLLPSKQEQFPELTNLASFVNARLASWGYRSYFTLGAVDSFQATIGTDLRYLSGQSNEFDSFSSSFFGTISVNFPVPKSYLQDPGLFADFSLPLIDNRLVIKSGVRFDWVRTAISRLESPVVTGISASALQPIDPGAYDPAVPSPIALSGEELSQTFSLWSGYIAPEWKVTDHVTLTGGFGYAQRPPTLWELYALSPFVGIIQRPLNFVQGNPFLAPETLRQADIGLRLNYDRYRGGLNAYYAWVHNYITYFSPSPASLFKQYVNTDEATLAGGEFYSEYDASSGLTLFGTLAYVEGRDNTRGSGFNPVQSLPSEPLPMIPPMIARAGFRVYDSGPNRRWAVEFATRMVATQDRLAESLGEQRTGGFTLFDLRGYWRPNDKVLFTAGMENIGDRRYRDHLDLRTSPGLTVFQPGFNAYVGARLTY